MFPDIHDDRFGGETTQSHGACPNRAIPVVASYPQDPQAAERDVLHYLPEPGLSCLADFRDKDHSDVYSHVSIEAVQ